MRCKFRITGILVRLTKNYKKEIKMKPKNCNYRSRGFSIWLKIDLTLTVDNLRKVGNVNPKLMRICNYKTSILMSLHYTLQGCINLCTSGLYGTQYTYIICTIYILICLFYPLLNSRWIHHEFTIKTT